jgi:uncharacterized membrane protein
MSGLPLHPAVVHIPVGLALVAPILAAGVALAVWKGWLSRRAFVAIAVVQAIVVASALAAMQLGERDEKAVERLVGEAAVERHEERAEVFVWAAAGALALSAAVLLLPAGAAPLAAAAVVAATLAVAGLAAWTGEAGGEIVYGRGGAAAFLHAQPARALHGVPAAEHDDD